MNANLRAVRPADAERCGVICHEAFKTIAERHNFPPDLPAPEVGVGLISMLLNTPNIYGVVAEIDGRLVGSNFLWEMNSIAGVGPITVDPAVQNSRIGRSLMTHVLERAAERRAAGVRLVQSAYHGRSLSLYTKLGFDTREPLSVLQGPAVREQIPGYSVRPATANDIAGCNALSLRIHGFERQQELLGAIKDGTATVVMHDGHISGYATVVGFFGHATGESNEDLKGLIGAAPEYPGPGFMVPTRNSELLRWCLQRGLRVVQPMTLMSTGLYNEPAGAFLPSVIY